MSSSGKRENRIQVNCVVELAGAQWYVHEWYALEFGAEKVTSLRLYRLTPEEQRLLAQVNIDWNTWTEMHNAIEKREQLPALPEFDIDAALAAHDSEKKDR